MHTQYINGRTLEIVKGDITREAADAIVNAANSHLAGGGGVDGAIHRAAGPVLMEECRKIGGCPTGDAVVTSAGNLEARYVIHAVGPIYQDGKHGERELLESVFAKSFNLASERGCKSVAAPAISTGVYSYPVNEAAEITLKAAIDHLLSDTTLDRIRIVLFDSGTYAAFLMALKRLS